MTPWSYSSLKDYLNCPKQYNEVRVLKRFKKEATEQMLYGTAVHKALEEFVRDGTPLPENYQQYEPLVGPLQILPGEKYFEHKLGVTEDRKPCAFDAPDCYARGILDFLGVLDSKAFLVDYKTGNPRYPDMKQLKLASLMVFEHFPNVEVVHTGLMFLRNGSLVTDTFRAADKEALWKDFYPDIFRLQMSAATNLWHPNPTGLCGWCPVTDCQYWRQR